MHRLAALLVVLALVDATASAHNEQTTSASTTQTTAASQYRNEAHRSQAFPARRNIRVDLTISDQRADGPNEKKQVAMIVSETSWGKIRTHATTRPPSPTAGPNMDVALND